MSNEFSKTKTDPSLIQNSEPNPYPTPGPGEAVDPVCHMLVEIAAARYKTDYNGQLYYFYALGCKRSFEKNPQQFVVAQNS